MGRRPTAAPRATPLRPARRAGASAALAVALLPVLLVAAATPPAGPLPRLVAAGADASPTLARALAKELIEGVAPTALATELAASHGDRVMALQALAVALTDAPAPEAEALASYLAAAARTVTASLAEAGPSWEVADLAMALDFLLLDPPRYVEDPALRARVLPVVTGGVDPSIARALREELLHHLNQVPGLEYPEAEEIALAWGLVLRSSAERRLPYRAGAVRIADDLCSSIAASLYVLPSTLVSSAEAVALLTEVRRLAPARSLLVMADAPQQRALEPLAAELGWTLIETHGRPFSPWPRDPLTWARGEDGGILALVRPDRQPGREEDAFLGHALSAAMPEALDADWGGVRWAEAPVTFHNGQLLLTPEAAWLSIHAVEHRALELLGLDRVPVESLLDRTGIETYLAAVEQAASELAALYRRPVRFVHPLPGPRDPAAGPATMQALGGGAGYDLDTWLTLLPGASGWMALVADLEAGAALLASVPREDLDSLAGAYRLAAAGEVLRRELVLAQRSPRGAALQGFLDLVAGELGRQNVEVHRLPLLRVPTALLDEGDELEHPEFLLGWNNVVVEHRGGEVRAEGFASSMPSADRRAAETYAAAGARLDLLPPLLGSVVRNGGYRCASSQLRDPMSTAAGAAWCQASRRPQGE